MLLTIHPQEPCQFDHNYSAVGDEREIEEEALLQTFARSIPEGRRHRLIRQVRGLPEDIGIVISLFLSNLKATADAAVPLSSSLDSRRRPLPAAAAAAAATSGRDDDAWRPRGDPPRRTQSMRAPPSLAVGNVDAATSPIRAARRSTRRGSWREEDDDQDSVYSSPRRGGGGGGSAVAALARSAVDLVSTY